MSNKITVDTTLRAIGLTPTESMAYVALLEGGPGTGYEVARRMAIARANAYAALDALKQRRLVERLPGPPAQFEAVAPTVVIGRLAADFAAQLDELQTAFDRLTVPGHQAGPIQERIEGDAGARAAMERIAARARRSVTARLPPRAFKSFEPFARGLERRGIGVDLEPSPVAGLGYAIVDDQWAAIWLTGEAGLWGNSPFLVAVAHRLLSF